MCVVSMVMDHGRERWPDLMPQPWINPIIPGLPPRSPSDASPEPDLSELIKQIELGKNAAKEKDKALKKEAEAGRLPTKAEIDAFLDLVKRAEEYDKRNNEPHCEDPEKIKFLHAIEERLARIEKALKIEEAATDGPFIYGSSNLPAHIQIGEQQVQLGTVVQRAFKDSGLNAKDWNELDEVDREHRLVDAIAALRKEV